MRDELTVQTDNFVSQAIGGVKLFVHPEDEQVAEAFFYDADLEHFLKDEKVPNPLFATIDKLTSKIPFIRNQNSIIRFVFFLAFVLLLLFPIIYFFYFTLE